MSPPERRRHSSGTRESLGDNHPTPAMCFRPQVWRRRAGAAVRGADRAAERASGYDDRRLEPGAWTSEGQRVESIYCISGRTRCPYACVWGVYAVSLRVCAVGLSLYCAFFGTVKACELCRCGWRRLATQMTQITVRVTDQRPCAETHTEQKRNTRPGSGRRRRPGPSAGTDSANGFPRPSVARRGAVTLWWRR